MSRWSGPGAVLSGADRPHCPGGLGSALAARSLADGREIEQVAEYRRAARTVLIEDTGERAAGNLLGAESARHHDLVGATGHAAVEGQLEDLSDVGLIGSGIDRRELSHRERCALPVVVARIAVVGQAVGIDIGLAAAIT